MIELILLIALMVLLGDVAISCVVHLCASESYWQRVRVEQIAKRTAWSRGTRIVYLGIAMIGIVYLWGFL